MTGLEVQATFERVESKFFFARCILQGSVEIPRFCFKNGVDLGDCGIFMEGEKNEVPYFQFSSRENIKSVVFDVDGQLLDPIPL